MGERCWVLSEEEVYYHVGFSDSSAEMNECFCAPSSSIVLVWAAVDARTTRKEARFVLVLPLEMLPTTPLVWIRTRSGIAIIIAISALLRFFVVPH